MFWKKLGPYHDFWSPGSLLHQVISCHKNVERHTAHIIVSWPNPMILTMLNKTVFVFPGEGFQLLSVEYWLKIQICFIFFCAQLKTWWTLCCHLEVPGKIYYTVRNYSCGRLILLYNICLVWSLPPMFAFAVHVIICLSYVSVDHKVDT